MNSSSNGNKSKEDKTLYDLLNVKPTCDQKEITEAFAQLEKKENRNSKLYKDGHVAYTTLSNPVKRNLYDLFNVVNGGHETAQDCYSCSKTLFENDIVKEYLRAEKNTRKNEVHHTVYASLEELFTGAKLSLNVNMEVACTKCALLNFVRTCPCVTSNNPVITAQCRLCHGSRVCKENCSVCKNTKIVQKNTRLSVIIEKGMKCGDTIRVTTGETIKGPGSTPLIVVVNIKEKKHPYFVRMGEDLHMQKEVNITEALCGCNFTVKQLDKRTLAVSSAGMVLSNGCEKCIKNEGMPQRHSQLSSERGNLIIHFSVKFPDKINKNILAELKEILPPLPAFEMPINPETEEYKLTDFDPAYKRDYCVRGQVFDDEKPDVKLKAKPSPCTHQ
nr:dnaJ homolog subfamily A member 2 [Ciona intestinalis]|eukprot:XP_002131735.1 dnaJ homolog subfamily A member 2 [Ciona intestinalis]